MVSLVLWLLLGVAVVAAASIVLAATHRIALRLATRNVRRARWRTVLVILGLLVATTIVSGSLVIGDTVNTVNVHFAYQGYGFTDEGVFNQSPSGAYVPFPYAAYSQLAAQTGGDPQIAGIAPEVVSTVQVFDRSTGIPQPGLNLIGADANQTVALGPFTATNGSHLPGPSSGGVYLDVQAAQDLNASVGNELILYGRATGVAVVQGIVVDDTRGGFLFGGSVFTPLATAQTLENATGMVNFLAVTNAGSLTDGVALSGAVSARLNASLASLPTDYGLTVSQLLKDALAQAETAGTSLLQLFLVLGLFSIVAGAMLIVGIFVMLAEERKGEMGMLRAIGLRRRELVLTYYFEGLLYSAGSALAGTFLGVAVGYLLTYAFSVLFSNGGAGSSAILASFTVTGTSLALGYVVGFLLTLATVTVASARASRLNIVRAIRSIPEPAPVMRFYTYLAVLGIALATVGGSLFAASFRGTGPQSTPVLAGGLVALGVALMLTRLVRNRVAFSLAGAALLLWSGVPQIESAVLAPSLTGSIFGFFVKGILMILGAILLYIFNSDIVVGAIARLGTVRPRSVPVVRIGLSYPGRRAFRTAINLTIFSLVLFTVVGVAEFGASVQSGLNATIVSESGGYSFFGVSALAIPDLPGQIANNTSLAPYFSTVVPLVSGGALLNFSGAPPGYGYPLFAAPTGQPPAQDFYSTNRFNFTATADGLSEAGVWQELATNASVAVVDGQFAASGFAFGPGHPTLGPGATVAVTNPATGGRTRVTVIGVLSESFVSGIWVNPRVASSLGYANESAFFLTVAASRSAVTAAQLAKAAFFPYGLILVDFAQVLATSIQTTEGFIGLLEIFVALGLAVGIAAMGIVALRAVAERRGEVGMLRAAGFTRGMVLRAFLLEYSYVALLGIGIGTGLAILLLYNATSAATGFLTFTIPWTNVLSVVGVSYALTILAILGPSVKAARLPPAEAIRYSE